MTDYHPHHSAKAEFEAQCTERGLREVLPEWEFRCSTDTCWMRFNPGNTPPAFFPHFEYRWNPEPKIEDSTKALRERNDDLTRMARLDSTQIKALKAKLEDCREDRHIAERRLEYLEESYDELQGKCDKLHEDLTVTAGRLWALQKSYDELRAKTPRYNHQCALAFTVLSDQPDGTDITPEMFQQALSDRVNDVNRCNEWDEACLPPLDTYRED